jgi:hypothetical protein
MGTRVLRRGDSVLGSEGCRQRRALARLPPPAYLRRTRMPTARSEIAMRGRFELALRSALALSQTTPMWAQSAEVHSTASKVLLASRRGPVRETL